jgi:hypothetical protein
MSTAQQVKLLATVRPEGISWRIADDEQQFGHGSCGCVQELRSVEVLAGLAAVEVTGSLAPSEREYALAHGWKLISNPEQKGLDHEAA